MLHSHIRADTQTHTHTYTHTYIHTYIHTHIHTHTYVHTHMHTAYVSHKLARLTTYHTQQNAHTLMHVHSHPLTHTDTHAHTHTHMHTYTRANTHAHVRTSARPSTHTATHRPGSCSWCPQLSYIQARCCIPPRLCSNPLRRHRCGYSGCCYWVRRLLCFWKYKAGIRSMQSRPGRDRSRSWPKLWWGHGTVCTVHKKGASVYACIECVGCSVCVHNKGVCVCARCEAQCLVWLQGSGCRDVHYHQDRA